MVKGGGKKKTLRLSRGLLVTNRLTRRGSRDLFIKNISPGSAPETDHLI